MKWLFLTATFLLLHGFLFDLVVNDVTGAKFTTDVGEGNAQFHHQHQNVIGEVCNFKNGFLRFVLCSNDDLGGFLTNFLGDFV